MWSYVRADLWLLASFWRDVLDCDHERGSADRCARVATAHHRLLAVASVAHRHFGACGASRAALPGRCPSELRSPDCRGSDSREPQACNYRPVITSMAVEVSQRSLERNLSGGKLLGTRRPFGRPKRVTGRSARAFSLRSAGAQPGGLREGGRGRRAAADPSQCAGTIRGAVSQNPIRGEEPCRTDGGNIGLTWPKSQLP
jgi:hypothetical protein